MAGFRSLRERRAGPPDPQEVLPLDVPPHLVQPLIDWLIRNSRSHWSVMAQMLKLDYTDSHPEDAIEAAWRHDPDALLDLVDARLSLGQSTYDSEMVPGLTVILALAGSGWCVRKDRRGLTEVLDSTLRSVITDAAAAEGSAGKHLASAWAHTYGRDRDATQAHAEMVRAVESAARPVLAPKDATATLGKMLRNLADGPFTTTGASATNDGTAAVHAMMQALWQQQSDRHGDTPTIPATHARVEFLLPIAAALVSAFSKGQVHRHPRGE